MICVGMTPDGVALPLPAPLSLRLQREAAAPADGLEILFPVSEEWETLSEIRCLDRAGRPVFAGIVDEQIWNDTPKGAIRQVIARSRAALLLDNEAQPQTYYMPSLKLLFERHAAPYGFTGYTGRDEVFGGVYAVEKGVSEWQALQGFCQQFLHMDLIARGNVLDASGGKPEGKFRFSNRGGIPFTELKLRWNDYERISEMRLQTGASGGYDGVLRDGEAIARGARRRRYLSGADAEQAQMRLEQARQKAFSVRIVCPGLVEAPLRSGASVVTTNGEETDLVICAWTYQLSASGETTKITLRKRGKSNVAV